MKRLLILSLATLLIHGVAFAQPDVGSLDVYTDVNMTSCNFVDAGGLVQVHVFASHSGTGTTAAQWKLDVPASWQHLGDQNVFQTAIGTTISGISIAYGSCLTGDFLITSASFFGSGVPTCTYIGIVPDPDAPTGQIEVVDCQLPTPGKVLFSQLGQGVVNSDGSCDCIVPVQDRTWGGIKAIYQ